MKKICFVCLGNICRSPMAEFVMREAASDASLEIASRATSGWEHGNPIPVSYTHLDVYKRQVYIWNCLWNGGHQ